MRVFTLLSVPGVPLTHVVSVLCKLPSTREVPRTGLARAGNVLSAVHASHRHRSDLKKRS